MNLNPPVVSVALKGKKEHSFIVLTNANNLIFELAANYKQRFVLLLGDLNKDNQRPAVLFNVKTRQPEKTGTWSETNEKTAHHYSDYTATNDGAFYIINWS